MTGLVPDGGSGRGRWGALMVVLATAAAIVASYLTVVKVTGGTPVCSVLEGCDVVNDSAYSTVSGVPVAMFGLVASLVTLAASVVWWRGAERHGLLLAYGIGLASLPTPDLHIAAAQAGLDEVVAKFDRRALIAELAESRTGQRRAA